MAISVSHFGIAYYARLAEQPMGAAERIQGTAFLDPDRGSRKVEVKGDGKRDAGLPVDRVTFSAEAEQIRKLLIHRAGKASESDDVAPGEIGEGTVVSMKKGADGDSYEIDDEAEILHASPMSDEEIPSRAPFSQTLAAMATQIVAAIREELSLFIGGLFTGAAPQDPPSVRPKIVESIISDPRIDIRV